MLIEVGRGGGYINTRDSVTGATHAIPESMAEEVGLPPRAGGMGAPAAMGGSGGGMGGQPGLLSNNDMGGGGGGRAQAIGNVSRGQMPAAPQGRALAVAGAGGGAQAPVAMPAQQQSMRRAVPPPADRSASAPMPLTETVRTAGRKAGYVPTGMSVSGIDTSQQDELEATHKSILQRRLAQVDEQAAAEYEAAKASRLQNAMHASVAEGEFKSHQAREEERQSQVKLQQNRLNEKINSIAKREFVPWADKVGIGSVLLGALAQAAGQYSAAINGGPNMASQLINNAIDRDLQLQQNMKDEEKDVSMRELDTFMRDNALTADEQRELMRALKQKHMAHEAGIVAADQALGKIRPQAEATKLDLEAQSNESLMNIFSAIQRRKDAKYDVGSSGGVTTRLTQQGKSLLAEEEAQAKLRTLRGAGGDDKKDEKAVIINGQVAGYVNSPKRAEKAQETVDGVLQLRDTIRGMRELVKEGGSLLSNKNDDDYRRKSVMLGRALAKINGEIIRSDEDAYTYSEKMQAGYDKVSLMNSGRQDAFLESLEQDYVGQGRRFLSANGVDDSFLDDGTVMLPNTR